MEATTNGILVKSGYAGVFVVHMTCYGSLEMTDWGSDWVASAQVRIGGAATTVNWSMFHRATSSANNVIFPIYDPPLVVDVPGSYNVSDLVIEENSTSSSIFVDASGGDVLVDVNWSTQAPNGSTQIMLREFTLELSELIDAAV